MNNYRHGDVGIFAGAALPAGAVQIKGPVVLAEGEVTGHAHRVKGSRVSLWDAKGQRYLVVECDDATLSHEDHGVLPRKTAEALPRGVYRVIIKRAWDPYEMQARRVQD